MNRWTQLVHFNNNANDPYRANVTPIYQTATFTQESALIPGKYDYSRSGNPTRSVLEEQVALLENGKYAFAFTSGMAALNATAGLLQQGDHIIASDDLYGGTFRLLSQRLPQRGIAVSWVDTTDLSAVANAFTTNTRLVFIETPSNPLQKISDIAALSDLAKANHALLVVDNTFLSPWLQQPLLLGADIVVHSATKHLSGHSDVTAGVIVVNDHEIAQKIGFIQNAEGSSLAPFDSWLLSKGIKTLGLRLERQQVSAEKIVAYLANQSLVKNIYYPGLPSHPGYHLHQQQAKGNGTVISFTTESLTLSSQIVEITQLFTLSVSFGSLTSLISLPSAMSHASIPENKRTLAADLIRLSIGIEDVNDLIDDLDQAFNQTIRHKENTSVRKYQQPSFSHQFNKHLMGEIL